jgi:hypothetical protein
MARGQDKRAVCETSLLSYSHALNKRDLNENNSIFKITKTEVFSCKYIKINASSVFKKL